MSARPVARIGVGLAGIVWLATPAWATIDNFKSYKAAYPGKDAKAYSCKVCHQHPVGRAGDLNAYGKALQQSKAQIGAKKLTVEDYRASEKGDADSDGASNVEEINAGTSPSDPASVPKGIHTPHAAGKAK
ncbi:MAG: hypothetical protein HY352_04980 [Candidatus Omnitrophica bacterium]|nr:hypothetical protein [Candidatus Omnitrophota bacterium]